jgi:hypothetical protein
MLPNGILALLEALLLEVLLLELLLLEFRRLPGQLPHRVDVCLEVRVGSGTRRSTSMLGGGVPCRSARGDPPWQARWCTRRKAN